MKTTNNTNNAFDFVRLLNIALMAVLIWSLASMQNERTQQLAPLQLALDGVSQRIDSWGAYHEERHNKLAERVDDGFREMQRRLKLLEAKASR